MCHLLTKLRQSKTGTLPAPFDTNLTPPTWPLVSGVGYLLRLDLYRSHCACVEERFSMPFPIHFTLGKIMSILLVSHDWVNDHELTAHCLRLQEYGSQILPEICGGHLLPFPVDGFAPLEPDDPSRSWKSWHHVVKQRNRYSLDRAPG